MSSWKGKLWSKVEGDGEVRVMTRGFRDLVAKLGNKVVMEVLVRCWSDGDVVCTLPTQGMRSIISMVSISPEGLLPSILMLVVIIVMVVIVTVILVVVVDDVSPILKLSFVNIGFLYKIVL
ncbi:hypothetical protein Tco_0024719 [Tanacetum coccineum]